MFKCSHLAVISDKLCAMAGVDGRPTEEALVYPHLEACNKSKSDSETVFRETKISDHVVLVWLQLRKRKS